MVGKFRKKLNEVGSVWKGMIVILLVLSFAGISLFTMPTLATKASEYIWELHVKKIGALTSDGQHNGIQWLNNPTMTGTVDTENWNMTHNSGQKNWIKNASLSVWSGGTIAASSAAYGASYNATGYDAMPDGWKWGYDGNVASGASRMDHHDVTSPGSGATEIYPGLAHSVYFSHSGNYGVSDYMLYPNSAVSSQANWYRQFAGKQVTFGAYVWTDANTTGATNLVRPFIRTSNNGATPYANATFGPYANGGWDWLSATTTVPNGATALDFGFEITGNAYSSSVIGTSGYMCGPTFVSGATVGSPIIEPREIVFLDSPVSLYGSSPAGQTYSAGETQIDVYSGTTGQIPRDIQAVYFNLGVASGTTNDPVVFRDTSSGNGVTQYVTTGQAQGFFNIQGWVKTAYDGSFYIYTQAGLSGCTPEIVAVELR